MAETDKPGSSRSLAAGGSSSAGSEPSDREHRPPEHPRRSSPEEPEEPEETRKGKRRWHQRPGLVGFLLALIIIAVVAGAWWWRHSRSFESTEDAFIDVVAQRVSAQVAGRVARVLVNDNEDVDAGQVLIELDPADFEARLRQARAQLVQAQAQAGEAEAQRAIREAEVEQARAAATAAATNAGNAASDLRRLQQARNADEATASLQQVEHLQAEQRSAAAQSRAAEKAVAAAQAQLAFVARQIEAGRAAVQSAAEQVAQAELTLSYAKVKAQVAGRVADRTVAAGNFVAPGGDLMAIVPRVVYVTADFKETQLARLRPGQPAEVRVDAYPDLRLHGRVDSVQPATGSAFTPIPAQNAAGNWVKVVQRVPVKITLDDLPVDSVRRLGPGMSVRVKVTVSGERSGGSREARGGR